MTFKNVESLGFNRDLSSWNSDSVWTFDVARYYTFNVVGSMLPFDYRVIFTEGVADTSLDLCMRTLSNGNCFPGFLQEGRPVNFKVQRQVSLTGDDAIDWQQIPLSLIHI